MERPYIPNLHDEEVDRRLNILEEKTKAIEEVNTEGKAVNDEIRKKYTLSDELAFHRKAMNEIFTWAKKSGFTPSAEVAKFFDDVMKAKASAKKSVVDMK